MPAIDPELLSILACPSDRGPLVEVPAEGGDPAVLYNPRERLVYRIDDGIPVLLVDEARHVDDATHRALLERSGTGGE